MHIERELSPKRRRVAVKEVEEGEVVSPAVPKNMSPVFHLPPPVQRVQSPQAPTVLTTPPKLTTTILMADPMLLPATTTISAASTPATINSMAASTPEFGAIPAIYVHTV